MKLQVSDVVETYSSYSSIPSPTSAVLLGGNDQSTVSVRTTWNTRDLKRSERTCFSRYHAGIWKDGHLEFVSTGYPEECSSERLVAFSSSGKKKAVLRETVEKGEKFQHLEIWDSTSKVRTFPIKNVKEHGKIYDDGQFGCLSWSPSEQYLLYVAEKKQPKYESFFEKTASGGDGDACSEKTDEKVEKGEENLYKEDWGEALVGKHHSVACVMNTDTGYTEIFSADENVSAGQAVWISDSDIVFVGWYEDPRRLGLIYCTNRRSELFHINVESGTTEVLCETRGSVRSPHYIMNQGFLVFLHNELGGPHRRGSKLMKFDWKTKMLDVVVDTVANPSGHTFPGLYVENIPVRCCSEDGTYLFLSTHWKSEQPIISVNISTGEVKAMDIDSKASCFTVLDVKNNVILASASAPDVKPYMLAGIISLSEEGKLSAKWVALDGVPSVIDGLKWSVISLEPPQSNENKKYPALKYEAILISPESNEPVPLIVWPHGGPHSVFTTEYRLYNVAFVKLGFAILMVNYRGSIGFGEDNIDSLLGNIGVQDVKDVQYAVESVMERDDLQIGERVLFGGSHGGFLVAHLSGQYPDFYKVCICRNPVIDVAAMTTITDIPDWNYTESGVGDQFDFAHLPQPELWTSMWIKSPVHFINNVTVPTLLLLGKNDLRVPPYQGKMYYHTLRARNVPVRMYLFDDNHALSNVGIEAEGFVQTVLWLQKHLP